MMQIIEKCDLSEIRSANQIALFNWVNKHSTTMIHLDE